MKKDKPFITNKKTAGVVILIEGKVNFLVKTITRDKNTHLIMIKGSIHQEDIKILNVYSVNKSFKMHKVKTDRTIRINIQIYPQASSEVSILHFQELNSKKTENQKEFRRLENHNQQI